jgi:hypothetical protein
MREQLALSSHQKNKRNFVVSSHQKKLQVFRFFSIFISLPLCQQFSKKERKEERK